MKRIIVTMVMMASCISLMVYAGDTNFVAQFDAIWQTRNATNILIFVEDNVATNASPEVFFARGIVAGHLQNWAVGATNYWEQAIQMISTNNAYAETEKERVIGPIRALQCMIETAGKIDPVGTYAPPSWNTNTHAIVFKRLRAPRMITLEAIANLPLAEE